VEETVDSWRSRADVVDEDVELIAGVGDERAWPLLVSQVDLHCLDGVRLRQLFQFF